MTYGLFFPQVLLVIGIVISVLLYRLVVAGAIYAVVASFSYGPSVGDIAVSVSGACIQLVAIIIMNKIYEFLAYKLTLWGESKALTSVKWLSVLHTGLLQGGPVLCSVIRSGLMKLVLEG